MRISFAIESASREAALGWTNKNGGHMAEHHAWWGASPLRSWNAVYEAVSIYPTQMIGDPLLEDSL